MKYKFTALLLVVMAAFMLNCNQTQNKDKTTTNMDADSTTTKQKIPADKNQLVGNWVRTDSPYQIKITEALDDGNLNAGYYNPKSIHIGKAMWNNADGNLKVYVELRDENYPGSNYKLNYYPEQDALAGEYFQAVEGNTYNVVFTRVK
ncbi:MAG: hypothetical protein U0W24_15340 [Bacteroidales bacterium]